MKTSGISARYVCTTRRSDYVHDHTLDLRSKEVRVSSAALIAPSGPLCCPFHPVPGATWPLTTSCRRSFHIDECANAYGMSRGCGPMSFLPDRGRRSVAVLVSLEHNTDGPQRMWARPSGAG